jgi:DHA3 family macrolide efflux protein-like MFS transporter
MAGSTSYKELKTQKQYLKMIVANIINRFGDSIDAIAISWIMYEITGSAALMALIIGLNYIPTIVLQPIFAVYVERMNKRRIMVLMDIARGLCMLATTLLFMTGTLTPALLAIVTILNSSFEAFRVPAGISIVPSILDEEHYTTGTALNSTLSRVAEVIGLALAGSVIVLIKESGALIVDTATFFISAFIISLIKYKEEMHKVISGISELKNDLVEGVKYILQNKLLIALFMLGMLLNFCMVPLNSLGTAYISDDLGKGADFLSYMQLSLVIGLAVGSFITPKLQKIKNISLIIISGIMASLGVIALAPLALKKESTVCLVGVLAATIIIGMGIGVQSVIYSASFMKNVDKKFLSRIGGLINSLLCAAMPLGSFLCSIASYYLPVRTVFLIFGVLMLSLYVAISKIKIYNSI